MKVELAPINHTRAKTQCDRKFMRNVHRLWFRSFVYALTVHKLQATEKMSLKTPHRWNTTIARV